MLTTPGTWNGPFWLFALVYFGGVIIVLLPAYLMNGFALHCISNRRGLAHSWLAWVPVGSAFVLGNISDDYQLLVLNNDRCRRLWLPLLTGATVVLCILALTLSMAWVEAGAAQLTTTQRILLLAAATTGIVGVVFKWIATYDLFRSCEQGRAGVYLGICVGVQILMPTLALIREVLMLVVCKEDLGMPIMEQPQQDLKMSYPEQPRKEPWDI